MSIPRHTIRIAASLLALGVVLHGVWNWQAHREQLANSEAVWRDVHAIAVRIHTLRSQTQTVADRARPTDDVIAIVHAVLESAGLRADQLADLRNDGDVAVTAQGEGPPIRRQSIALTLRGLTVGDLGLFLQGWRNRQTTWQTSRIALTALRGSETASNAGRYDVALVISAFYLGEE